MKNRRSSRTVSLSALVISYLIAVSAFGLPRPPWPPFPERELLNLRFDGTYWLGYPRTQPLATLNIALADSWSGQALDMSGPAQKIFALAIQDSAGKPRLNQSAGSLRFWFVPTTWSGPNGAPGHPAILFELGTWTPSGAALSWWTLAIAADGTAVQLLAHTGGGSTEILRAPLLAPWLPGQWHQIGLVYDAGGSGLFLDGALAAQGPPVALSPLESAQGTLGFAIGASVQGDLPAEGLFDEFYVFPFVQSSDNFAWNWQTLAPIAALGPVTDAELAARRSLAQARGVQSMDSQQGPPPPGDGGGGTNCTCNTLTNFTVDYLYSTNGLALGIAQTTNPWIALTIQTATTNATYDMFGTTNLADLALPSLGRTNWTWLRRVRGGTTNFSWGETNWCERYFQLGTMQDSDNDGLTDAYEQLVSKTATNAANSPRAIYEGVISNQYPNNWFKLNDGSLTNSISGQPVTTLTNTGTWDVDAFATGSNAISFTNTSNSERLTTGDVISGGSGTNQGSICLLFRSLTGLATTRRYVFCQKGATPNEFGVFFEDDSSGLYPGTLCVQIGGQTNSILGSNAIVFGAWYYLAITWDETRVDTNGAEVAWYLGRMGATLTNGAINLLDSAVVGNSAQLQLGNREGDNKSFRSPGSGALDEIAFWNRELTNTEINAQFTTLTPLFQGPSKVFDLTRWNLLLPVNSDGQLSGTNPIEINTGWLNSGFKYLDETNWTQKYFYLSTTNTMVFEAPWNGAYTTTSSGPRSELRETNPDGSTNNWPILGTNTLEATCALNDAGTGNTQKVIIGQIHENTPSSGVAAFTVNYNLPALKQVCVTVKYHPDGSGSPSDQNYLLATNVNLGDPINYRLQLEKVGTNVTLHAVGTVSGVTISNVVNMTSDASYSGWGNTNVTLYFKAGCYYPNNPPSGTAKVTFSSLSATHQ